MPIGLCTNGHFTGFRKCGTCGSATVRDKGTVPPVLDKKQKRVVTMFVRTFITEPAADMRKDWMRGLR